MTETSPEYRLIGLGLMDPDTAIEAAVTGGLSDEWFADEWTRKAWYCITSMHAEGHPIDPAFVVDWGAKHNIPLTIDFLKEAEACAPSSRGSPDALVCSIRQKYIGRAIVDLSETLSAETGDPESLAVDIGSRLLSLAEPSTGAVDMDGIVSSIEDDWARAKAGLPSGLPMPWEEMFHRCGSIDAKQVAIWVGHGGSGKSSILTQWVHHLGVVLQKPVLYMPFEDTIATAYKRMACMDCGVSIMRMRMGECHNEELAQAKASLARIRDSAIIPSDKRMTSKEIAAYAQRIHARKGICAIFIDALKDISRAEGMRAGDNNAIDEEKMETLTTLAKRIEVPIVCAHHIRKKPVAQGGNRWDSENITKDDVKGAGRIWDDARMVLALQQYTEANEKTPPKYQFQVLKANHGQAGEFTRMDVVRDHSLRWTVLKPTPPQTA